MLSKFNDPDHFPEMDLKEMERKTGFLVHLDMSYPLIMPFMKDLYLTINSWRLKKDRDGWKLSKRAYDSFINDGRSKVRLGYYRGYR